MKDQGEDNIAKRKSRVIVISSVSGGGKTSLIRVLMRNHPELQVAITATSRKPREGEVDGVHYYFYDKEEFQRKVERDEFLEHALVHGNYYGVPAAPLYENLDQGKSVILNIDVQGKRTAHRKLGERVLSIFLMPPNRDVWEERLRNRGTDAEQDIQRRLREGHQEMKFASEFDYRVVNELLESAAGEVSMILKEEGVL